MAPLLSLRSSLLGLSACLVLAACSGKDDDTGASTTSSTTTTTNQTTSTSETSGASNSGPTTTSGTSSSTSSTTTGDATDSSSTAGTATTSGTTGDAACEIELPDPGSCNGGAPPLDPRPTLGTVVGRAGLGGGPARPAPFAADEDPDYATTGCAFICDTTGGGEPECDIWAQDCPDGEKCNAWVDDGGSSWNATKCVPVDLDPGEVGEPCTVVGSAVSGVDSCALGATCWGVDENNEGTCVELCTCTPDNPVCTTPNTTCTISNDGVLILCLPVCDPLDPGSCAADQVCVSGGEYFKCAVDASGSDGAAGDSCEYLNACDPGLFCADSSLVPGCFGIGCCTPFCDIGQPACGPGTECVAWYDQGQAPKCFEDVGACVIPE